MSNSARQSTVQMVLFDVVGTLIVPQPPVVDIYCQVGRRQGSRVTPEQVDERFRAALAGRDLADRQSDWTTSSAQERAAWHQIVGQVFGDVPLAIDQIFHTLWDHFAQPSSWRVEPEVAPLWRQLRAIGLRIGLASNFDERLDAIARQLEPLADADAVFYSAGLGARKPGRAFFTAIQRRLGLPGSALMMVGDDLAADYHGALQAGWHAVWLNHEQTESAMPDRISRLSQLVERL